MLAVLIHPQTVRSIFGSIIFAQASSTLLFFEFVVFRIRCLIESGLPWHTIMGEDAIMGENAIMGEATIMGEDAIMGEPTNIIGEVEEGPIR